MNIGNNIAKLRKNRGWSQINLATQLNITQKVVSDYETNKRKPPIDRLPDIANLFNISVDKLLDNAAIQTESATQHIHKSSRLSKIHELLEELTPEEERAILKHIKGLIAQRE
jgi:transcriptional regulator with XRE-family HTH domain